MTAAIKYFGEYAAHLLAQGYEPLPVTPGTKAVRVADWQKIHLDDAQITRWLSQGKADFGVGLRTKFTPAVDIDVRDAQVADAIEQLWVDALGDAPCRVGQAPKRLLLFRTETPFSKLRRDFADKNGEAHAIEILGDGQQFVAYGIHPTTGKPFDWNMDDPMFRDASALPLLSREKAEELLVETCKVVEKFGWFTVGGANSRQTKTWDDHDPLENFTRAVDLSDTEIDEYLLDMPNDADTHYDTWSAVGMALWHQYQGSVEGYDRWVDWSERGPKHNDADMAYKWESFNDSGKGPAITFKTIIKWVHDERKKHAVVVHADLVDRIANAADRTVLDAVKKDLGTVTLDPESRDDLLSKLHKAYKRIGLDVNKTTLRKAITVEKKAQRHVHIDDLELALAQKVLADHFAGGAHIKRFAGACWLYRKGVWRMTETEFVKKHVMDTLVAMKASGDEEYKALLTATQEAGRDDRLSSLVGSVMDVVLLHVTEDGNTDPLDLRGMHLGRVINCKNGELWFNDKGEMRFLQHNPAHRLTHQINADYDPEAICPEFEKTLNLVFSSCSEPHEVARHWLEMMGVLLQPKRMQAFWLLMKGPGSNGKSTLMDIISGLMGADSCYAGSVGELPGRRGGSNNHFTASLIGKLMFLDDDMPAGILLPDDWVKKLSEEKLMTANPKGSKTFEFTSRATLVCLSNTWPSVADITVGMRRRAQVIEMNHTIPEGSRDPRCKPYILKNELSGVLNLLLGGLVSVLARGGSLLPAAECRRSQSLWLHHGNPNVRFVHDVIELDPDAYNLPAPSVYEAYKAWVMDSGERVTPLGKSSFYATMQNEGLEMVAYQGRNWFRGIRLRNWRVEGEVEPLFADLDDDCGL
jgi:P4 family phage/plasmid primase-like protien